MRIGHDVFTTGSAAAVCAVAARTVSKWCDTGQLKHFRIPGSKDRRILRKDFMEFLRLHGLDLDELESAGTCRVLLICVESSLCKQLRGHLPECYTMECASSGFDAGIRAEKIRPDVTIIDLGHRTEGVAIGECMRRNGHGRLVALASEDETRPDVLRAGGFAEVFMKPFDTQLLAAWIEQQAGDTVKPQRWTPKLKVREASNGTA